MIRQRNTYCVLAQKFQESKSTRTFDGITRQTDENHHRLQRKIKQLF